MADDDDDYAQRPNKARLTLPLYKGLNDGKATRDFCRKVDSYQHVARLTDEETAQAVTFTMVPGSAAHEWITNTTEENPDLVATWPVLRPLLVARFSPALTPSEKSASVDLCKQKKDEDVLRFFDKCRTTQLLLDRNIPDAEKAAGNGVGYQRRYREGILGLFLCGLREEGGLKTQVNGALGCVTLDDYKNAAIIHERHVTHKMKVTIAEVATNDDQEGEQEGDEVANIKVRKGKQKKKGGNGAQGGGQPPAGNGRAKQGGARSTAGGEGGPRLCWTCQSPDHLNFRCPDKKKGGNPGRPGGNNQGQHGNNALETAIMQLGWAQLSKNIQGGERGGAGEAMSVTHEPPPPQYRQGQNFW